MEQVVEFLTQDYRKRFQVALDILTEIYAADVAAKAVSAPRGTKSAPRPENESMPESKSESKSKDGSGGVMERRARQGFELYNKMLLAILSKLSDSLETQWQQRLFTQTLLECPRVPPEALELVSNLCHIPSTPHHVQTGEVPRQPSFTARP